MNVHISWNCELMERCFLFHFPWSYSYKRLHYGRKLLELVTIIHLLHACRGPSIADMVAFQRNHLLDRMLNPREFIGLGNYLIRLAFENHTYLSFHVSKLK